jgi:hypothetical protein
MINYSLDFEKFMINEALLVNMIVYWVQAFSIRSLFILIQFELDRIVHYRLNITVT